MTTQSQPTWITFFLGPFNQELRLRALFEPARRAQLNQQLRQEDLLHTKGTIFSSTFILFNLSLVSFWAIFRTSPSHRYVVAPSVALIFGLFAYKLGVQWLNGQFLRSIEKQQSEVAYCMRRKVVQEFQKGVQLTQQIGRRIPLLKRMNQEYDELYKI